MNEIIYLYFIAHILIGLTVFFLALFILIKNKTLINVCFFFFYLAISMWAFFYAAWLMAGSHDTALFLARTLNMFAILIPVLYLNWLLRFLNKYSFKKMLFFYIATIIFLAFSYSDIFIIDVKQIGIFDFFPQSNWLHKIFLVEWSLIILSSYYLLLSQYKKETNPEKKKQILFVLIGALFGFVGGSFNFLLMLGIDIIPPVGSVMVIMFPIMVGYGAMKYNLMNARIVFMQVLLMIMNVSGLIIVFTSNSLAEYIINSFFIMMVVFVSYLLIKNYNTEIKQKEELVKLTKELERANRELKILDKAKSEFISIASHQLRTPLTAIKGYISLILEGAYGKNSKETEGALNKIFLANERLIQLVEDLLNITRIESGRLEYHMTEDVHLGELLEELRDMFILRAKDKGLDFVVVAPDKDFPIIKADRSKLREVISNLIDNAIKYTKEGFVHVSAEYDDKSVRIIVEDSGVGISEESMKTLFAKFSRGTDSSKVYTEGTGLGLYVGKNLIESQGGRIYAQSDGINKGSRFIIEMPIKK